jgi:hypothetical protein
MCPITTCTDVDRTYGRRRDLSAHLKLCHPIETCRQCPFCFNEAEPHPIRHLGHHMEEIAFGVLTTAYENWSYNDTDSHVSTSSVQFKSPPLRKQKKPRYGCKDYPPCQRSFNRWDYPKRHISYVFEDRLEKGINSLQCGAYWQKHSAMSSMFPTIRFPQNSSTTHGSS